ncbi:MAG: YceI family protein [Polyangiaceae bacterium]|jgi:polyisoprenoid-binding protein YceI|nr:YceI family protein [Polyangiaceae bacterium]
MSTWNIDGSHSSVTFSVRHLMISNVKGEFQKVSGVVNWDAASPEASSVEVTIEVASINTREDKRDGHLKSAEFFDAEQFPHITFRSTAVKAKGEGAELTGDLTIRGVTRSVTLTVDGPTAPQKDPWGNTRVGASGSTKIKRSDFGMTWNAALEAGGVLVGDDISIHVDVSLVKG